MADSVGFVGFDLDAHAIADSVDPDKTPYNYRKYGMCDIHNLKSFTVFVFTKFIRGLSDALKQTVFSYLMH